MELKNKKVLIFAGPDFEDRELFYPQLRLIEAGATVKIAGIGEAAYKGKYGIPVQVDGQTEDFLQESWDAVIVPGGWAPDKIRANSAALEIVKKAANSGKLIAAVCHGPWVLASADVVRNRTVTSYKNIKDDLINAGARWQDKEVVVDCNIITSRTPADLPAFCREIVKLLSHAAVTA